VAIDHGCAAESHICDKQGLIGREMFAIDGVKLPSNASKSRSGTRADFERQAGKLETAAKTMLERHREEDRRANEPDLNAKERRRNRNATDRKTSTTTRSMAPAPVQQGRSSTRTARTANTTDWLE
jgi:hypothetical protein